MESLGNAPAGGIFTLSNGHNLYYSSYGDLASSNVVFYQHGLPGSHLEASMYDEPARQNNIRVLSIDRPGMGQSTFQPNYRFLDWPAMIVALADHLHIDKFAVLGISGGAPYALACLHRIPITRCVGGAVVAGVNPSKFGYAGMVVATRMLFNMGAWSPWLVEKALDSAMVSVVKDTAHPEKLEQFLDKTFETRPDADKEVWNSNRVGIRDMLIDSSRYCVQDGAKGAAWEFHLIANKWGFEFEDIRLDGRKLILWHGQLDANWPIAMAQKAHQAIADSEFRVMEADGHVSVFANTTEVTMKALRDMFT